MSDAAQTINEPKTSEETEAISETEANENEEARRLYHYVSLKKIVSRLRDDLNFNDLDSANFILVYAYNGTGKTRLSMEFKQRGKTTRKLKPKEPDTLYFNAYTEDLFYWDNDLDNDTEPKLHINSDSKFFAGFKELELESAIFKYYERYASFNFKIDYEDWTIRFYKDDEDEYIKISRGEEAIFVWCIFMAICELAIDEADAYKWVKYIYIDDPISSLDDNNAIAVACDLAKLLKRKRDDQKVVISSHHSLFFNVMSNELKKSKHKLYFLHKASERDYTLQATDDTPFFHHVATLSELKKASETGRVYTHHFNMLRAILEKTSTFFGYKDFSVCIDNMEDKDLFSRALNVMSHGQYSTYAPIEMGDDTKDLFEKILHAFLTRYQFELPKLMTEPPSGRK